MFSDVELEKMVGGTVVKITEELRHLVELKHPGAFPSVINILTTLLERLIPLMYEGEALEDAKMFIINKVKEIGSTKESDS